MISTETPRRRSRSSHSWICAQASESFSRTSTVRLEIVEDEKLDAIAVAGACFSRQHCRITL
jgi:hypothetical protein